MADDDHSLASGPSASPLAGADTSTRQEFTSDQIVQLENVYERRQYSDSPGAMEVVMQHLRGSDVSFSGTTAGVIESWFINRQTEGPPSTVIAVQAGEGAAPVENGQLESVRLHEPKRFNRQKDAMFQHMLKFSKHNPGANIVIFITSPSSNYFWGDGRGPYMNADSVLGKVTAAAADVLKVAADESLKGALDWQRDPGARYKRKTAHRGGGYMLFQSAHRASAIAQLTTEGVPLAKGTVEKRCAEAWSCMTKEQQSDYHRQSKRRDAQQDDGQIVCVQDSAEAREEPRQSAGAQQQDDSDQQENVAPNAVPMTRTAASVISDGAATLGNILAGGHHLGGQRQRRARQHLVLNQVQQTTALPPPPPPPRASRMQGGAQAAGAVARALPLAVQQDIALRVRAALQQGEFGVQPVLPILPQIVAVQPGAAGVPPAQSGVLSGTQALAAHPPSDVSGAMGLQGVRARGMPPSGASRVQNSAAGCTWTHGYHGCCVSADQAELQAIWCGRCDGFKTHEVCAQRNIVEGENASAAQKQLCYFCASADQAVRILEAEVEISVLQALPPTNQIGCPGPATRDPAAPLSRAQQGTSERSQAASMPSFCPARKSARVQAGTRRPPRYQSGVFEVDDP